MTVEIILGQKIQFLGVRTFQVLNVAPLLQPLLLESLQVQEHGMNGILLQLLEMPLQTKMVE